MTHIEDGLVGRVQARPRATASMRCRGSCPARRGAGRRRRNAGGPRAQAASVRRPTARRTRRGPATSKRLSERLDGADVPQHLGVVSADVAPRGERVGVAQVGGLAVRRDARPPPHARAPPLRPEPTAATSDSSRSRTVVVAADRADHLRHVQDASVDAEAALHRRLFACEHAKQRGLADAVRTDERGLLSGVDLEGDVAEQAPGPRAACTRDRRRR